MRRGDEAVRAPNRAPRRGRLSPAVLGWLVIAASLLVIGMAARHTADLGPDPSRSFDCGDTTCTDLWSAARHHNATVAVVAAVGVPLGWVLVDTGMPRVRARYQGRGARRWSVEFWTLLLLMADAVMVIGALTSFMFEGVPAAVFFLVGGGVLQGVCLWRIILGRPDNEHGRSAWWAAGGAVCAATAAWMALAALLFPVLFVVSPVVAGLILPGIQWWALAQTRPGRGAGDQPVPDGEAPIAPVTSLVLSERGYRVPLLLWVPALIALACATAWACERVPPQPADAWKASDQVATPSVSATGQVSPTPSEVAPAAPSQTTSAMSAADPGLADCAPAQLRIVVGGFDGETGNSSAEVRATNVSGVRCALRGRPGLTLVQGGQAIALAVKPMGDDQPAPPPQGIALGPGTSASARLAWPGYRNAADQTTPQNVSIVLGTAGTATDVRLHGASADGYSAEPGPAPFDIKAEVPGGAVIFIGRWRSA